MRDGLELEIRPRSGDLFGFYEVLLRRDYFRSGQTIREGDTVIDVGANIGCFAVAAARLVGSTGIVYAIEPEKSTFRQLLRNIEINELKNVVALNMAIGGQAGDVRLHAAENRLFSSIFDSVNGIPINGSSQEVPMTTLDALMQDKGIRRCQYLKLDCEGAEHEIVRTLSTDIAERITQMTIEVHRIVGFDRAKLEDNLIARNYRRVGKSGLEYYQSRSDHTKLASSV